MVPLGRVLRRLRGGVDRVGFAARYRLAALTYRFGVAVPRTTAAGRYWSYEPTNAHGDDPGLAALDALSDDAVILDIGGHTGEYAVPLAVGTRRRVISFEPNGRSADRLRRTVERNGVGDRVDVRRMGIGDVDDERPFYRSTYSKLSAFDRDSAARWGGAVEAVDSVPIRRLDTLVEDDVPPPDGIKIDVEGAELDVLSGATRTIEAHRPLVVVERHGIGRGQAVAAWFRTRDYEVTVRGDAVICRPEPENPDGKLKP